MTSETRVCQNCKQEFRIEPEDFGFYEKIKVPPPTWCPDCRNMRRMAWRVERSLYRGTCKLCGRSIITMNSPRTGFTVYCRDCFNSDKWDPLDYGRDYDFSRSFFAQYRELMEVMPRPALTGSNLVNSEFTQGCEGVKNCYYTFYTYFSQDSQNSYALLLSRNAYDCYVADNSDHVYEILHSNRLYRVRFAYFCDECLDSSLLFDCVGCSDCFGCVNLRKQKHCLFNEKLSKEEYFNRLKYWDLGSYQKIQEARSKLQELYLSLPHRFARVLSSQNVTGDIVRDAKDCKTCFIALDGVRNCKYLFGGGLGIQDSMDVSMGGNISELMYETFATTSNIQRNFFSDGGSNSTDIFYSSWARNSSHLFGCISLKNKKYCILNKQYAKEEYETLFKKIREQMDELPYVDRKGRVYKYGEFFPTEISACAYNESWAFLWYPKTKEEVLNEGWQWREPAEHSYAVTLRSEDLPDHIKDVGDSILEEVIGCAHQGKCNEQCSEAFRLTREELEFYREMNLALPRLCFNCRYIDRLKWQNGFKLWHRRCACLSAEALAKTGAYRNTAAHAHGSNPCPNEFETTFSPEKPEIIYCDQCYKAEFL